MIGPSRIAVVLLACGFLAQPIRAQTPGPTDAEAPFRHAEPEEVGLSSDAVADLADLVRGWTRDTLIVGAEILVVKDGRAVLHEATGWSDLDAGEPMRKHSIFRLLALTKPFTGTAALMLVEDGRLELDAPVSRWLPSWANEHSGEVTVRQLLTHTAGWEQYGTPRPLESYPSLRAMVNDAGEHGPRHPPGQAYRYSDVHSYALGALVAEVSGVPVERFIEARILTPLGLDDTHTRFAPDTVWAHRVSSRYQFEEGARTKVWSPDQPQADPFFRASGGLFSTAMDYARWLEAWMGWIGAPPDTTKTEAATSEAASPEAPRLLSRRTARAAVTPAVGPYGFQWEILSDDPLVFGHGGVDGTHAMAIPSRDLIVVYLTQSQGRELRGEWTAAAVDAVAPGLDLHRPLASEPAEKSGLDVVELTPAQRARYSGRYRAGSFTVRIFEEGGRLHRHLPSAGSPRVTLVPLGDHIFATGRYEAGELAEVVLPLQRMRFVVEEGRATVLELMHDGEVRVVLPRVAPAVDTVHVAPPTGETEADQVSIVAALEEVRPGGVVRFAPGTYLVGEIIAVPTPRITLLGHPDGTTLRGCDPSAFGDRDVAVAGCNGFSLTGGHQAVRDLTFEYTWHALILGGQPCEAEDCPPDTHPIGARSGGYVVERNTFRESPNGIRVAGQWQEPAVIRDNRFINTYHAVMINGMTAHVVDNQISVPEPGRVPNTGHPGLALLIGGWGTQGVPACDRNVIAGNRIAGHPDAIVIMAFPESACRRNEIRGNTIEGARVGVVSPSSAITVRDPADSTVVGAPVRLLATTPEAVGLVPGAPAEGRGGLIEDNLIEGNRIIGAEGLAIEVVGASGNRIVDNTVIGVAPREPFPGNTLFPAPPEWGEANGSGIWLSPGSDGNQIVGNTFEDVAGAAVFLEGAAPDG